MFSRKIPSLIIVFLLVCSIIAVPATAHAAQPSSGEEIAGNQGIPIFPADRQEVIMFWYKILAGLSGAFIFLILIKSGYQHITNPSPASRASLIETIQKAVCGILIISFAPLLVTVLININNGFVDLCLGTYNALTADAPAKFVQTAQMGETEWMDRFIAAPFKTLNNMITALFSLAPLGEVIFNEAPRASILSNNALFAGDINVGNELGTAIISLAILGFTLYYNAVYTIRRWVVTAVLAATPIIAWIWVLSGRRQVMDIWLSEIIQTIFMQSFHALTFGIFFSILCFTGSPGTVDSQFAHMLIEVGKFLAAFGGVICFGMIVLQGFKIIAASDEKNRMEAAESVKKALLGLAILGLAAMIASYFAGEPLTVYFPSASEGETNITLWQLFFVLIAIIPVSKMFSNIFMSFLARIGTVDEDAWAAKGLGIMGGIFALGKAGAGAIRNTPAVPAPGMKPGGGPMPGVPGNILTTGTQPDPDKELPGLGTPGVDYPVVGTPESELPRGDSVYAPPPGMEDIAQKKDTLLSPQAQQMKFQQAVLGTRETVDAAAKIGKHAGEAAGFAAPGSGQALGSFFGLGARVTTAPIASAHAIYELGRNLPKDSRSLVNITGRETTLGAGAQIATAVLLSPIGASSANIAIKTGSVIDRIQKLA